MGTTAEKLKYLNETKAEIKNALETSYNVMRDYPELIKKYIDNQPTKVVTDGICGNEVDVPVKVIEINGNIRQETTEGYQLLDTSSYSTETKNGVTATRQRDGSIKVTGTATADVQFDIVVFTPNSKDKAYFLSGCPAGGSISTYCLNLNVYGVNDVGEGVSFTNKVNPTYVRIKVASGVTIDKVFYLMITEGVEKKPYEPYTRGIPSPNPDYTQKIENIDGYNMIDKIIEESRAWGNGVIKGYSTMSRTDYIEVKPNTTYYASHSMNGGVGYSVWFYDKDKQAISSFSFEGKTTESDAFDKSGTFTTPSNAKYLIINYLTATIKTTPPVLVEGTNSKPYLPYGCIGLKQSGKNKVDFINYAEKVFDSSKVEKLSDGSYKFKHCDTVYTLFEGLLKAPCTLSWYARNDGTGTSLRPTFMFKIFYEDGTTDTFNYETSPDFNLQTKVLAKNVIKIVNTYIGTSPLTIIKDVQLEEGSKARPYEPYRNPIITPINLQGNILSKMRDVKDILRVNRNGKVEIKKNIGKVVLTGEEVLIDNSSTSIRKWWGINFSNYGIYQYNDPTKVCDVLTTKFKSRLQQGTFLPGQVALTTKNKNMYFVFKPDTTEEQARAILTDMPVYFRLAEPQTIKLSSISPIELWQGTNIFKLITNLDTDFEVEYVVDKDSVTKEDE